MPHFSDYELQNFITIIQQQTGFNFPVGLEREFSLRLERALEQQGLNLNDLLLKIDEVGPQNIEGLLAPVLPHLLIGETYFWREPEIFEALTNTILPEIVQRKGAFSQLLRVWSAACSTGEEVYSLAILLRHFFKDSQWIWSVMGSDLNEKSLETARRAEYGNYSFRTAATQYPHCFEQVANQRWQVKPEYRRGVRFQKLNLAALDYPRPANDTCNYDLIFCRNIFIYFSAELSHQIIDRLYEALNDGGYLIVSPCEYSPQLFSRFEAVQVGGVTFYRRPLNFWALLDSTPMQTAVPSLANKSSLYQYETLAPVANKSPVELSTFAPSKPPTSKSAKPLAALSKTEKYNQLMAQAQAAVTSGQPEVALQYCEEAIALDVLQPQGYLFLASLYQERGQPETALEMARKFTYLEPERPEGQFYLASLQQTLGRNKRAIQAYKRLLSLLAQYPPKSWFEHLPNLSCGELQQLALESLLLLEAAAINEK